MPFTEDDPGRACRPQHAEFRQNPSEPKIFIDEVSKTYGLGSKVFTLLDDVSLSIQPREFVCILGPSGAGKTTLLEIIAGFKRASSGRIVIDGRTIQKPGQDRMIVFQHETLFPWLTVRQNIAYGPKVRGGFSHESMRMVDTILEDFGLTRQAALYPKQLSGGERKRAEIARAVISNPSILLMDEPFALQDTVTRARLQNLLQNLFSATNLTILYVTHDIYEAAFLADRIAILSSPPTTVKCVFEVPFDRPRHVGLQRAPEFARLCENLATAVGAE